MKTNKKGFTLVEIIVSIAVGSIVLMIAGAIILSSSQFLSTTTEMDLDKRCVDSIVDFVRGEIEYSTETRLVQKNSSKAPEVGKDGWHSFYVKDKVLYRDDVQVFQDEFYSYKEFRLAVKGHFENESRIDLYYELYNTKGEKAYSTRDTVMLLNVKVSDEMKSEGLFTQEKQQLTGAIDGYALYYRKTSMSLPSGDGESGNDNSKVKTGTVADQIDFKTMENNRGLWTAGAKDYMLIKNDFVFHNGYWWMLVYHSAGTKPGSVYTKPGESLWWKCIDSQFHNNSAYEVGDVIMYNNIYYKCINSNVNKGSIMNTPDIDTSTWEKVVDQLSVPNTDGKHNITIYSDIRQKQTIVKKLENIDLSKLSAANKLSKIGTDEEDEEINKIPKVIDENNPQIDEIYYCVKEKPANLEFINDSRFQYIQYYIKLFDYTSTGVTVKKNVLQELCVDFKKTSAYVKGDIVLYNTTNILFVRALRNIDDDTNPDYDVSNKRNWEIANL